MRWHDNLGGALTRSQYCGRRTSAGRSASIGLVGITMAALSLVPGERIAAQADGPEVLVPNLAVRTVAGGLALPTAMAFLGQDDILVLEKNTGRVQRIRDGAIDSTVLDLAVNFASERFLGQAQRRRRSAPGLAFVVEKTEQGLLGSPLRPPNGLER